MVLLGMLGWGTGVLMADFKAASGYGREAWTLILSMDIRSLRDRDVQTVYGQTHGMPGLELGRNLGGALWAWGQVQVLSMDGETTLDWAREKTRMTLLPLTLGLRVNWSKSRSFKPFVGLGASVVGIWEKAGPVGTLSRWKAALMGEAGVRQYLGNGWLLQLCLRHQWLHLETWKSTDLGGWSLCTGVGHVLWTGK